MEYQITDELLADCNYLTKNKHGFTRIVKEKKPLPSLVLTEIREDVFFCVAYNRAEYYLNTNFGVYRLV